jgi:hypothetical protein
MYRRTLTLTPEQRAELVRTRDRDRRPYLRDYAAALLKIADGQAPFAVARVGLARPRDPDTVYSWLAKYQRGGLAALVHRPRGHRGFSPRAGGAAPRAAAPAPGPARPGARPLAPGGPAPGAALAGGL